MTPLSRRELVIGGGSILAGGALGAIGVVLANRSASTATPPDGPSLTFSEWAAQRKPPYLIGHRGVGGVYPEHTLPSYLRALDLGSQCIEVSVVRSSDGILYCHHDLTLDRTTTLTGDVRKQPSTALDAARVSIPRLGPGWSGPNMPPLPRLSSVLDEIGGRAILCIEPKDDSAYTAMIDMIRERELMEAVIVKLDASSPRIQSAKASGFPVFAYLGNADVATKSAIERVGKTLDGKRDCLVIPARADSQLLAADLVLAAVRTGVPVWVFPIHRRHELRYFSALGVEGIIAADVGYLAGTSPKLKADTWSSGQLTSGEVTRNPYSNAFNLQWADEGVISIPTPGRQAFLSLGSFCPIEAPSYRISFDMRFDPLPTDTWQHLSIAFGHSDDRYYEHRIAVSDGYHAILRGDGTLGIYSHVEGNPSGRELAKPQQGIPLKSGVWSRLTLDVTPDVLRWSRDDGSTVEVTDSRFRGGYFHIGSSAIDGRLQLRGLTVT